ncbi:MAG: cysteine sulfinate desulfinase [Bacteroidetes bacterium GWF2_38_335]|nr:MAG: cysteine sulfinate desulfinase [Bacteroidetes bacterium GWF2_38_335]OFY77981.1 MAG: cysteine sulfinate desulfinase [Bacteroidetes bacterium RIFOXYA12_FULL_38_20]
MQNIKKIREDFPILSQTAYGKPLVYFDNAATTQKPSTVLDIMDEYYKNYNGNIHRGVHFMSDKATAGFEKARKTVQKFINASSDREIIFTSGTTGSINLVASSFGEKFVGEGDEIIVSEMEHHSNIVPWQLLCERKKAVLKVIPFNLKGELEYDKIPSLISEKTKLISVTHISNALGTVNDIRQIIGLAHKNNIPVLIDGAQAIQHLKVDVQELDCDFYAFSGHKIYGPTGTGVLYGKESWLEKMPPYQGGGEMIRKVSFKKTTFNDLPFKFEAGTPNYIGAIGMGAAIEYVQNLGIENIAEAENELLNYGTKKLSEFEEIVFYGTAEKKASVISFLFNNLNPYDVGTILDKLGIAVRTGTHCTEPLMEKFNITGTVRASFAFYNTKEEIDKLIEGLVKVKKLFG